MPTDVKAPLFPGCMADVSTEERNICFTEGFFNFFSKNFKGATNDAAKGRIVIDFEVSELGIIENVNAVQDIGFGTKEECLRVFGLIPKMKPALNENDQPIRHKFTIPIVLAGNNMKP